MRGREEEIARQLGNRRQVMEDQRQLTLLWDRFLGTQPVLMLNYNFFLLQRASAS